MELNEDQRRFKASFKALALVDDRELTLDDLESRVVQLNGLIGTRKLTAPELAEVVRSLTSEVEVILSPGGAVVDSATFEEWIDERRPSTPTPRWDAYKALLLKRDWEAKVINDLAHQTDEVVELMGDPLRQGAWLRRGLLMGEVQSGKTANYIGVLNKALDYGYQVVIVIGGHTNELRRQTQRRVDSDLLGIDSEYFADNISNSALRKIGVGLIDSGLRAHLMTTVSGDFNSQRKTAGVTWIDSGHPTVFVIKKHAGLIANVANYIRQQASAEKLNLPLIVIDDEADWGTPNTGSDTDPTRVNREIRRLLETSSKSTYLGITATPFANIFINAEEQDSQFGQDLFPSDYIRVLSAPSTYFGMDEYSKPNHGGIKTDVEDCLSILPIAHKRTHLVPELPESLREATVAFLIGTAIRRIRTGTPHPASMLVNVSRFIDVQAQIANHMSSLLDELKAAILSEFGSTRSSRSHQFEFFLSVWESEFSGLDDIAWDEVRIKLLELAPDFRTEMVNSRTVTDRRKRRKLMSDEQRTAEDLCPTVFIGGDVLSRGLTLEGLQVSYFVREPRTMDTLMQMARWFGYRPGYSDLVRVWLPTDTAEDFSWSAEATTELKELLLEMQSRNLTPKDFGLRVRTHPEGFKIVAANKSKWTEEVYEGSILWENRLLESDKLPLNPLELSENLSALDALIFSAIEGVDQGSVSYELSKSGYPTWSGISLSVIQDFFAKFRVPVQCDKFGPGRDNTPSLAYQSLSEAKNAQFWDVSLINGDGPEKVGVGGVAVKVTRRNKVRFQLGDQFLQIPNRRVASANNLTGALSREAYTELLADFGPNPSQAAGLAFISRPRLMLYLIVSKNEEEHFPSIATASDPLVAVAIAYPKLDPEDALVKAAQAKKYVGNSVYIRNRYSGFDDSDDLDQGFDDD